MHGGNVSRIPEHLKKYLNRKVKTMSIKSIVNFIKDERGAESVEFGVTSVVVAAGAVNGLKQIQGSIKGKQEDMVDALDAADA